MKNQVMSLIAVCGLAAAVSPLLAQSRQGFKATVPFDFQVGGKTMPPGVYIVEPGDRNISLQSMDGSIRILQLTSSLEGKSREAPPALIFKRYGDTTFLYRVQARGRDVGHQLPKSKLETQLAAKLPPTEVNVALAGNGR